MSFLIDGMHRFQYLIVTPALDYVEQSFFKPILVPERSRNRAIYPLPTENEKARMYFPERMRCNWESLSQKERMASAGITLLTGHLILGVVSCTFSNHILPLVITNLASSSLTLSYAYVMPWINTENHRCGQALHKTAPIVTALNIGRLGMAVTQSPLGTMAKGLFYVGAAAFFFLGVYAFDDLKNKSRYSETSRMESAQAETSRIQSAHAVLN